MIQIRTKYKGFWQLADPKIWVASTVPMLLGASLAINRSPGRFNLAGFLAALFAVYMIEIGKNAINEYVDFKSGVDSAVDAEHRTPFSGGKKTIVDGLLTPIETLMIAAATFMIAAATGLALVFFHDSRLLIFGLAGMGLAAAYSLPPLKLAYRGLGELTVGFVFGPLLLNGMYFLLTGAVELLPVLLSLPIGFLIADVLVINQFPDYEADKAGGKKNWVVRLGKKHAVKLYGVLYSMTALSIVLAALVTRHYLFLIGLLPVPLMVKAVRNAAQHYHNIPKLTASNAAAVKIYLLTGMLLVIASIVYTVLSLL